MTRNSRFGDSLFQASSAWPSPFEGRELRMNRIRVSSEAT
jgi:hypothetical protein